jgi:beta-1,4-mannosyltransferase
MVDQFSVGWMWKNRGQVDVLHVHWLELLFVYPTLARSIKRWLSVVLGFCLARTLGICVVYTVHNIQHHEGQRPTLYRLGNRVVFSLAQAIHVHDSEAARVLAQLWHRRRGVHVIPHGNYSLVYGNTCTRAEARQHLGLDQTSFVYLSLGRVRPYKGIEELLEAFRALPASDAVLIVAGEVHDKGYDRALRALAGDDPRIHLQFQYVPDEDLQFYLNSCDLCVLPYRHVTTSGAAILAFSFAVPIIAPRLEFFVDLVGEDQARGLLYSLDTPNGLREALELARYIDIEAMRSSCRLYAENLHWNHIARQHAAVYHQCSQS